MTLLAHLETTIDNLENKIKQLEDIIRQQRKEIETLKKNQKDSRSDEVPKPTVSESSLKTQNC